MITVNNFHDLFTLREGKLCEIANNNNNSTQLEGSSVYGDFLFCVLSKDK